MGKKAWSIMMGIGSVGLIVLLVISYLHSDHTPPKLVIQDMDITYVDGMNSADLLVGVSAYDETDGDLTNKIFVDQIIPDASTGEVIVVYGVQDRAQNVVTGRRAITYGSSKGAATTQKADTATESGEEDATAENTETGDLDAVKVGESEVPTITLTGDSATIKRGDAFIPNQYVDAVSDDADDENTLMQHLHVDGEYDAATAGTYQLYIYVTDTEGNRSAKQPFALTIQ